VSARPFQVGDLWRFKNDHVEVIEFIPAEPHFGGVSALRYAWLTEIDVDPAIREHSSRDEGRLIGLARAAEFVRTATLVVPAPAPEQEDDGTEAESLAEVQAPAAAFVRDERVQVTEPKHPLFGRQGRVYKERPDSLGRIRVDIDRAADGMHDGWHAIEAWCLTSLDPVGALTGEPHSLRGAA
jgi:hypothetical protein